MAAQPPGLGGVRYTPIPLIGGTAAAAGTNGRAPGKLVTIRSLHAVVFRAQQIDVKKSACTMFRGFHKTQNWLGTSAGPEIPAELSCP